MITPLHYLILLTGLALSKTSGETAFLQGDFHIAGLFQIYTDDQCSQEVDEMSVRNFEAVKWAIRKLNDANYVPGLKLGLEGFPTCNVHGRALEHATRIMNRKFGDSKDTSSTPIIGLIGPEYSHEAMDTSSYISSLGKNNFILQTLFSATASALSDGTKYQNILRVIPEDSKQSSVIVSLMENLSWNYIGVVYENNSYGIGNYEELKKLTKTKKICVALQSSISVKNGLVSTDEITTTVESLIYHSIKESKILGVVIFASTKTAESILKVAHKIKEDTDFQLGMIFSEGSSDVGITTLSRFPIAKGSFFSSPPWLQFDGFKTHWLDVLTNKTAFTEEVASNPWLKLVLKKFISCDVQDASCSMPDREEIIVEHNVFEGYAILAIALQAQILKDLQKVSCGTNSELCQEFNNTLSEKAYTLVDKGRETQVNVNSMPIDSGLSMNIHFDDLVEATITGNVPEYEVYHFRNCIRKSNDVCLEKVGDYNNSSLTLNKEKLRDYTRNADGLAWPDIIRAQCDPGKLCRSCLDKNLPNEILFKKGDLYVAAVVPVYNKDTADPLKCGNIREANGWEVIEGIRFAVETVNKKNGIFRNYFGSKQLGYVILNSCNQPLHIQSILLKLFKEGIQLSDGSHVSDIRNKTLGFVAAYGSSVSVATASVLQEFKFPQISYASTAAVLSDRTTYKYFLRTCTPDDKQALAMLNIVKTLNSSYIQIMYSEGTYGEGGRNAIVNAAKESKICVANEIKVKENDYKRIRDDLLKTPYATIILLFLKSHVINDVLEELHKTIEQWSYIFIGSEAFGTRKDIITERPKLEGTISLSLQMKPLTGISEFETYLYDRLVTRDSDINPWTREYFEKRNGCYMSGSFNKMFDSQCSDIAEQFNNKDYKPEIWTSFAINAVFSLLQGSNKAFEELCGTQSSSLCKQYRDDPSAVYNWIKNQRMVIDDNGVPSNVFNDNGDGNIGYKIYQVQKSLSDTSQLTYEQIGRFTLEENGYSIHDNLIKDPHKAVPSKCPNPVECQKCSNQISIQTKAPSASGNGDNSIMTIILGALLGLSIIALIVTVVLFKVFRRCNLETTDNLYLDPNFTNVHGHSDTDDSGYSANAGQGEHEQSPRMQTHRRHNQIIHDNIAYHANN